MENIWGRIEEIRLPFEFEVCRIAPIEFFVFIVRCAVVDAVVVGKEDFELFSKKSSVIEEIFSLSWKLLIFKLNQGAFLGL